MLLNFIYMKLLDCWIHPQLFHSFASYAIHCQFLSSIGTGNKQYQLNGVVEGCTDLFSALAAIIASLLKINWPVWGEITMGGLSFIATIVLFVSSYTHIVYIAYACNVIHQSTYAFAITIARYNRWSSFLCLL